MERNDITTSKFSKWVIILYLADNYKAVSG